MKISQKLDRPIKKDRTVFTSSAQVYGPPYIPIITENEHSQNGSSTSAQVGVGTCTERPKKTSKKRALDYSPEAKLEMAKALFKYSAVRGKVFYRQGSRKGHAVRQGNHAGYRITFYFGLNWWIHRIVWMLVNDAPIPDGYEIDHVNSDRADNRPANLRLVTRGQNQWNAGIRKDNTSGYKGVTEYRGKRGVSYSANISINGKVKYLGAFPTALEASEVYQAKATELRGEFVPAPPATRAQVRG